MEKRGGSEEEEGGRSPFARSSLSVSWWPHALCQHRARHHTLFQYPEPHTAQSTMRHVSTNHRIARAAPYATSVPTIA